MNSSKWNTIKSIFSELVDLPLSERKIILEKTDTEIRIEVENLLLGHNRPNTFIEKPLLVQQGLAEAEIKDIFVGKTIGHYLILEKIGSGGMGLVYLAERQGFQQKVALKLIKRGMDSEAILKRFFLERQILSRLNHPNIAHLLDGGTTEDGLPYFVMEYVKGLPLLTFCDLHQFDTKERLELFRKICSAVSYAHQNLIVHRDLKPSNILVTEDGTPKLLDFGIAKLLDTELETTATQIKIFTPEYASPEQLNGLPITTSADVYSLGVVLYELLSGVRPFNSKDKNYQEIAKMVLTEEPLRPSSVVSGSKIWSIVKNTQQNKGETQEENYKPKNQNLKSLRGDIDNIILKALRKEPQRRYLSVQEFSEDIRRNLNSLPVTATSDSRMYRFKKFVRRKKLATAVAALILLLSGLSIWQGTIANSERAKAERRLVETRKIANSLMFEVHDSLAAMPGATASREILVKRALEYLDALSQESDASPELLKELAIAYRKVSDIVGNPEFASLGSRSDSITYSLKAFEIHKKLLELDAKDVESLKELGTITETLSSAYSVAKGDLDEGLKYARISQETYKSLIELEPDVAIWKSRLAKRYNYSVGILTKKHDYLQAEKDFNLAIKYNEEALTQAPEDPKILVPVASTFSMTARRLGDSDYNDYGNLDESLKYLEKALVIRKKLFEGDSGNISHKRSLAVVYDDLGVIYKAKKDYSRADEYFRMGLILFNEIAEKDPKDITIQENKAYNLMKHGETLLAQGNLKEAFLLQSESVKLYENWSKSDPESIETMTSLAQSKESLADTVKSKNGNSESLHLYQESLNLFAKAHEKSKLPTYETIIPLARIHLKIGKIKQININECPAAYNHFQKSYALLHDFLQRDRLSPTNTEIYVEVKQLAESFECL